jgi:hypothetical protein
MPQELYVSRRWDAVARARFLLRQDIQWPLSVDPLVWPSVFFSEIFKRPELESCSTIEVDPAIDGGKYWLRLDAMRTHYDSHRALAPGGVFIGVELLSEKEEDGRRISYVLADGIQAAVWLEQTVPDRPPDGSTLLGYDVADASLISGLSNCEYTEEETSTLAPVWGPRLNSFGLLTSLEDALPFRQLCDARVPEHAPFWIYALWRLPLR